jgi:hypothetical protein
MTTPDTFHRSTVSELARLVADATQKAPELGTRPEKAAIILLAGKVAPLAGDAYEVVNSDGDGAYRVDHAAGTCDCPDYTHRAPTVNGAKLCKHRLAVVFLRRLERPRRPGARTARLSAFRPACVRRAQRLVGRAA